MLTLTHELLRRSSPESYGWLLLDMAMAGRYESKTSDFAPTDGWHKSDITEGARKAFGTLAVHGYSHENGEVHIAVGQLGEGIAVRIEGHGWSIENTNIHGDGWECEGFIATRRAEIEEQARKVEERVIKIRTLPNFPEDAELKAAGRDFDWKAQVVNYPGTLLTRIHAIAMNALAKGWWAECCESQTPATEIVKKIAASRKLEYALECKAQREGCMASIYRGLHFGNMAGQGWSASSRAKLASMPDFEAMTLEQRVAAIESLLEYTGKITYDVDDRLRHVLQMMDFQPETNERTGVYNRWELSDWYGNLVYRLKRIRNTWCLQHRDMKINEMVDTRRRIKDEELPALLLQTGYPAYSLGGLDNQANMP